MKVRKVRRITDVYVCLFVCLMCEKGASRMHMSVCLRFYNGTMRNSLLCRAVRHFQNRRESLRRVLSAFFS